jgi:DNA-binding transcriptional LysR family regulator
MIYASLCWSPAAPGSPPPKSSWRIAGVRQQAGFAAGANPECPAAAPDHPAGHHYRRGERIYEWAQRILQDVDEMMDELSDVRQVPQGTLRIISSFGFGRRVVAPALSALALQYPQLELRFDVQDRLVDLVNEGVDLDIRVGDDIAPNLIARQLVANHRVLCASPQFLARHPPPKQLSDLAALPCLVIKERDHPFGVWQLHIKRASTPSR